MNMVDCVIIFQNINAIDTAIANLPGSFLHENNRETLSYCQSYGQTTEGNLVIGYSGPIDPVSDEVNIFSQLKSDGDLIVLSLAEWNASSLNKANIESE